MAHKRKGKAGGFHYIIQNKALLEKPLNLTFYDEKEGDEYVRRLEASLAQGKVPKDIVDKQKGVATDTLRGAVTRYMEAQHISGPDRKILPVVIQRLDSDFSLSQVTFVWATKWVSSLKRDYNLSPSTLRHHVGALARALDWIAALGEIPTNPLRLLPKGYSLYTPEDARAVKNAGGRIKEANERDRRLEPGEEERIRAILNGAKPPGRQRSLCDRERKSLQLMFDMALESAMRMREMFTLEWAQVDLERRTIFLDKTKNGSKRQVPISSTLLALLKDYDCDFDGRLFPFWDGINTDETLARVTAKLSRQWARVFDAAGCVDLHFHDLRHEATSRIYERTSLSDLQISTITGHRSMTMLRRYANLRASTLAERMW